MDAGNANLRLTAVTLRPHKPVLRLLLPTLTLAACSLAAQTRVSALPLPDQTAGTDAIVSTLLSAFDTVDIVALGEAHQSRPDSELRIALIRNPGFAAKVHFIVVEFASTSEQHTLDRYIRGEDVPLSQLQKVWKTTTQAENGIWDAPLYLDFLHAVREVNATLAPKDQMRVLGGDPGPGDTRSREVAAEAVVQQNVLHAHGKALVIYGAAHFYRAMPSDYLASMGEEVGLVNRLETDAPGRVLSVIRIGWLDRPKPVTSDVVPDFQKFDRAIRSSTYPVLLSLQKAPFQNLGMEEFLGRTVTTCRPPGGCRSAFKGTTLTLGQIADACVYYGGRPTAGK